MYKDCKKYVVNNGFDVNVGAFFDFFILKYVFLPINCLFVMDFVIFIKMISPALATFYASCVKVACYGKTQVHKVCL